MTSVATMTRLFRSLEAREGTVTHDVVEQPADDLRNREITMSISNQSRVGLEAESTRGCAIIAQWPGSQHNQGCG
jgi:hypothetical protein